MVVGNERRVGWSLGRLDGYRCGDWFMAFHDLALKAFEFLSSPRSFRANEILYHQKGGLENSSQHATSQSLTVALLLPLLEYPLKHINRSPFYHKRFHQ